MSLKNYIFVAIGFIIVLFVLENFMGGAILGALADLRGRLHPSADWVGAIVTEPLRLIFSTPIIGAIIGGLFWPFIILELFGLLIVLVLAAAQGGYSSLQDSQVLP